MAAARAKNGTVHVNFLLWRRRRRTH